MVVYEKIYLVAYINKANINISIINNTAQLYFILERAELCLNFFSTLKDAPDI